MNFLNPNDRLAILMSTPNRPAMKIPVLDIQQQMTDDYCDRIELLNLQLEDQRDATKLAESIANTFRQQVNDLNDRITSYQAAVRERSYAVSRCTALESDVKKLQADLKTEVGNRDHFRALVVQQDAFIKEAKRQIEEYKLKKEGELRVKTSEAEHLAKQAVRLNDDITKFSAQNVRLIDEKRKLQEQVNQYECEGCITGEMGKYCGGCLGCHQRQTEHSMSKIEEVLKLERKASSFKDTIISTLTTTLNLLDAIPFFRWKTRTKKIQDCKNTIQAVQGQIDNVRLEQKRV